MPQFAKRINRQVYQQRLGTWTRHIYFFYTYNHSRPHSFLTSIAMLHIDIRASIDRLAMASPQNSITLPVPPAVPITPMMCKTTS